MGFNDDDCMMCVGHDRDTSHCSICKNCFDNVRIESMNDIQVWWSKDHDSWCATCGQMETIVQNIPLCEYHSKFEDAPDDSEHDPANDTLKREDCVNYARMLVDFNLRFQGELGGSLLQEELEQTAFPDEEDALGLICSEGTVEQLEFVHEQYFSGANMASVFDKFISHVGGSLFDEIDTDEGPQQWADWNESDIERVAGIMRGQADVIKYLSKNGGIPYYARPQCEKFFKQLGLRDLLE